MHTFYKEVGGFQGSKANMMYECESTLKVCIRYYYCFLLFCFYNYSTNFCSAPYGLFDGSRKKQLLFLSR